LISETQSKYAELEEKQNIQWHDVNVDVKHPTYSHHCQLPAGRKYVFSPENYLLSIRVLVCIHLL